MKVTIREGKKEDAAFIAQGIMDAIGEEICREIGRNSDNPLLSAKELFTRTAAEECSQYSYRNALIAEDESGMPAGVAVSYDGSALHLLREAFVKIYNEMYDANLREEEFDDETSPDEIYLDTLAVKPEYRGRGLGSQLIAAVEARHAGSGKPLGLLVDYDNRQARHLYEKIGFGSKGARCFCGVEME
ncbi:MAG: GNAT family N-acetyltransferase, partial [Muribaculaceae bacterium]|nr:GNAT family N-acetyltransferase [Muribaculaceae bacterium]